MIHGLQIQIHLGHWLLLWFYDPRIADSNSVGGQWIVLCFYDPWIADSNSVADSG